MPQPPPAMPVGDEVIRDAEQIKLLVIFHYVTAGMTALGASLPIVHVIVGAYMLSGGFPTPPSSGTSSADMQLMGWMFVLIGGAVILIGWTVAVLTFFAGRFLSQRRRANFVFVMACILCLNVPFGTALGIFTILVLQRPSVKALFYSPGPKA